MSADKYVLYSENIRKAQVKHSNLFVIFPFFLLLLSPLYLDSSFWSWSGFAVFMIMGFITGCLGISMGFHRYFSHKSFLTSKSFSYLLAICGQMAGQGSVFYWTALHRRHHSFSDKEGDPHSPNVSAYPGFSKWSAFWRGHIGWSRDHAVPLPSRYVADLLKDKILSQINLHYKTCFFSGVALSGLLGMLLYQTFSIQAIINGVMWGSIVRICISNQAIWAINSVCHYFGSRPHETGDQSTNNIWLLPFVFGENWHNNHHHNPTYASFSEHWYQLDVTAVVLWGLEKIKIVSGKLGPNLSAAQRSSHLLP